MHNRLKTVAHYYSNESIRCASNEVLLDGLLDMYGTEESKARRVLVRTYFFKASLNEVFRRMHSAQ